MCAAPAIAMEERGIQHWMERVLDECERVGADFGTDAVHDLRVALRRCRAMAEGIRAVDPDPRWRKMRRAAKGLFSSLGELRDVQVVEEWVRRLGGDGDPARDRLLEYFAQRESELKVHAGEALAGFDRQAWQRWARSLSARAQELPLEAEVFEVIALEKLQAVMELQRTAMRTRSKASLHAVRIGLKRLRYVVENFLPEHDQRWRAELKQLQDALGEVHDLDVLWATALRTHSFGSAEERQRWRTAVARERSERVAVYRQKLAGRHSLLYAWREELPTGERLKAAIEKKFATWAGFLDPDKDHTQRVVETSLRAFDQLLADQVVRRPEVPDTDARELLKIAAMAHEVGRVKQKKARHKRAGRMLQKLDVPPGWTQEQLQLVGMVARYHRGALPFEHMEYKRLSRAKREMVALLGGILRMAEAAVTGTRADALLERGPGFLMLKAEGHSDPERLAAACYLLETVCGRPILVRTHNEVAGGGRRRAYMAKRP
jgi:CHAD domain-containing protein